MEMENIIDSIAERAAAANAEQEGDYIGDDGLLYCGKCHTRKQCRVTVFGKERIVYGMCKCKAEEREREEAAYKQREKMTRIQMMRESGFPDAELQKWTFARDDRSNVKISDLAHRYVKNFEEMKKRGKGLLLFGSVGTGKTFISACIANALIDEGYPCLVTNFARLVNKLSGMYEGKQDYIDGLNRFDLLVIDDLASERDTEFMGEIVQNIIDSRYRSGLPIIVTTNLTSEELKKPAEIRKQRIYSRLFEMCVPVEVKGKDRRKQKLRDEIGELEELLGLNVAERGENEKMDDKTP